MQHAKSVAEVLLYSPRVTLTTVFVYFFPLTHSVGNWADSVCAGVPNTSLWVRLSLVDSSYLSSIDSIYPLVVSYPHTISTVHDSFSLLASVARDHERD